VVACLANCDCSIVLILHGQQRQLYGLVIKGPTFGKGNCLSGKSHKNSTVMSCAAAVAACFAVSSKRQRRKTATEA
jgi:hypothetical protein